MATLNTQVLVDKLAKLNSSQQSIETLSAWCTFHRKAARQVVSVWDAEFAKASVPKRLALTYLANDILQNSRKKGPEFVMEFFRVLPKAMKHLLKHGDAKVAKAVNRILQIWEERKVRSPLLLSSQPVQLCSVNLLLPCKGNRHDPHGPIIEIVDTLHSNHHEGLLAQAACRMLTCCIRESLTRIYLFIWGEKGALEGE